MKRPRLRGAGIDMGRMRSWISSFGGYRVSVSEERIDRWLVQFARDRDLAARILDSVDFVGHEQMANSFRDLLNSIEGWHRDEQRRRGRWRFVAHSSSAGESGDTMLHRFRVANTLNGRRFQELFIHKSELLKEKLSPSDTVVFVDDFSGTGNQICQDWVNDVKELLAGGPRVFLILIAVCDGARRRIEQHTDLTVHAAFELSNRDNIFSQECGHFSLTEKRVLLGYCRRADPRYPRGFGDCGLLIVFAHSCPNNSIPILHASNQHWEGLFRRYD